MYVDDVLDLIDALDEMMKKSGRMLRRFARGQSGASTFIMVLVMLVVGALVLAPMMGFLNSGLRQGRAHQEVAHQFYSADTGIEDAMWKIKLYQLPAWLQGKWGNVYNNSYSYQLSDQFNSNTVNVTIRPVWLLEGLETPAHGREPHAELVTVGNLITGDATGGRYKIAIVLDAAEMPGNYKLDRIGVWLPPGWDYVEGSSTLEQLPISDPAYCPPSKVTQTPHNGGTAITWDYSVAVNFEDFPPAGSYRIEIGFDYALADDAYPSDWVFGWCRTNRHDIYLSWTGSLKTFELTSTAYDPTTGKDTTIRAYTAMNEAIGMGTAVNGDYSATGNALVRDQDKDGYYRERIYLSSPGTISDIPSNATARKIMLYWSGWKKYPMDVWYENTDNISAWSDGNQQMLLAQAVDAGVTSVSVTVAVGADSYTIPVVQANSWQVVPNADNPASAKPWDDEYANGWSYSCCADITDLVRVHFGASFDGNATYTIGHAEPGVVLPTNQLQGVWGSSASNVITVGASGTVERYDGTAWTNMSSGGFTTGLNAVWGSDSSNVFAAGARRNVRYYNGSSWSSIDSSWSGPALYGVWGSSASNVYVVGESGTIRRWDGSSWTTVTSPTSKTLNGIWGSSANDIFAVGTAGSTYCTIVHWNGTSWTSPWSLTPKVDLYGVWGTASNNVYAVGGSNTEGKIFRYNGSGWAEVAPAGTKSLRGIWGSSDNNVFAVGLAGTILQWDGIAWNSMTSGSTKNLYGVWGSGPSDVYAVGQGGAILHYDGNGEGTWTKVTGGVKLYSWGGSSHTGESVVGATDCPLGDPSPNPAPDRRDWWGNPINPNYQGSYAAWSVFAIYSSPDTAGHQLYLYDTLRCWLHYQDKSFEIKNFVAPANVVSDPNAARLTCFVGEGDGWSNGGHQENVYIVGEDAVEHLLNTGASGTALANNNVWNSISNAMTPSPDGLDLDTFVVSGSSGIIKPGDSSATVRMNTYEDVWMLVYMILSFRSDVTASGFGSYVVLR